MAEEVAAKFSVKDGAKFRRDVQAMRGDVEGVGDAAERTGKRGERAGKLLKAGFLVGAAVVGTFGKLAVDAFGEMERAQNTVRVGTGATGEALEGLMGSVESVATRVPASFEHASTAVADLNTRMGLTGEPLEQLSGQFLELARITGGDVAQQIALGTRAFGDWDVAVEDTEATLDKFFRGAQASGATVDDLMGKVVQFGSPLRQMGFGLEESIAMFAKFEKEGVNAELVVGSLRQGLGRMARAGEDAPSTFRRVVGEIEAMEDPTKAVASAMELFGARAGPDMAAAIREGRFDLDELMSAIEDGSDTIMQAGADTMTFADKWQMLKNRATPHLAAFGGAIMDRLVRAVDVASEKVDQFTAWLEDNRETVDRVKGIVSDTATVVLDFARNALGAAIDALRTAYDWYQNNRTMVEVLGGAVLGAVVAFKTFTGIIYAVQQAKLAWAAAQAALNFVLAANPIGIVILVLAGLAAGLVVAWKRSETFRNVVTGAFDKVKDAARWVGDQFRKLSDSGRRAWAGMKNSARDGANWIIEQINKMIRGFNRAIELANKIPGINIATIGEMPMLRAAAGEGGQTTGGITARASGGPTLPNRTYRVGEHGPEFLRMGSAGGRIIPASETADLGGVGGVNVTIHPGAFQVLGSLDRAAAEQLADVVVRQIKREAART